MAVINKTGITNGGTIQAEHVTRAIDALSSGTTDTIIATGSFSGSLTGNLTGTASWAGNATTAISATSATNATNTAVTDTTTGTGPYYVTFVEATTGNVGQRVDSTGLTYNATTNTIAATASVATSASFATTASYVANASSFPFTGSAIISGSLIVTGSARITGSLIITGSTTITGIVSASGGITVTSKNSSADFSGIGGGNGRFILPNGISAVPAAGAMYWDDDAGLLYVYRQATGTWVAMN